MTTRVPGGLRRLLAAAALVAAAAAACSGGSGVTVVVDFHQLGGGVVQRCDAGGSGKSAKSLFDDAGFALAYVQRQPGFVCRVDNKPGSDAEACVTTPPQNAYWGLFWADGTSSSWKYSTLGVSGLTLRDGQSVAFSWQGSAGTTPPGVKPPTTPAPSPSPSPTPSSKPSPKPSPTPKPSSAPTSSTAAAAPSAGATSAEATPTPGDDRSATSKKQTQGKAKNKGQRSASAEPTPTPEAVSASASPVASATAEPPSSGGGGGLPGWALPAVLLALAGAGGATAYLRRRAGGSAP